MIHHVDRALETFLRQQVPLPEASVDVSFRTPDGSWTASVSRPTVDVFLWDVVKAKAAQRTGIDERMGTDGRRQRRAPAPKVVLRYLLTVWTRDERDEHELLGAVLRSVLATDELPRTALPATLADTTCRLLLGGEVDRAPAQLWDGAPPKPGLHLEVELAVDAAAWSDRGPAIEEVRAGVASTVGADAADAAPAGAAATARPGGPEGAGLRRYRSGSALVMEGRPAPATGGTGADAQE